MLLVEFSGARRILARDRNVSDERHGLVSFRFVTSEPNATPYTRQDSTTALYTRERRDWRHFNSVVDMNDSGPHDGYGQGRNLPFRRDVVDHWVEVIPTSAVRLPPEREPGPAAVRPSTVAKSAT
jgi:hypothetical protein